MSDALIATDKASVDVSGCFDMATGILDRRIFTDEEIYQEELKKIFGRAWNFVCHESQIPNPGDFMMNYIGEDEVIVVRDRQQSINVLLNSCPHRGNTVCRAELGNTKSFFCSYHGWNYDLDGRLIGMPGEDDFYRNNIDKKDWGLTPAAKVENYQGFYFATLDPEAPPLEEYLGWVGKVGIDFMLAEGDIEFLDGIHKNRLQCNWKLAVDNLYDWYHVKVSHGSAIKIGILDAAAMAPDNQMVILGEYGHGIGGPGISEEEQARYDARLASGEGEPQWYDRHAERRTSPETREMLGPVGTRSFGHPNISQTCGSRRRIKYAFESRGVLTRQSSGGLTSVARECQKMSRSSLLLCKTICSGLLVCSSRTMVRIGVIPRAAPRALSAKPCRLISPWVTKLIRSARILQGRVVLRPS